MLPSCVLLAFAVKVRYFRYTPAAGRTREAPTALGDAGLVMRKWAPTAWCDLLPMFRAPPALRRDRSAGHHRILYGHGRHGAAQHEKLVAYSSVSHLGSWCWHLLVTQIAWMAVYQMLNHGISTGALFVLVGYSTSASLAGHRGLRG